MVSDLRKWPSLFFLFLASSLLVAIFFLPVETSEHWTREAGPIEDFGAIMFLAGAAAAIAAATQSKGLKRVNFVIWAALALIFFGEETSYLQHWIGYSTPVWIEAINAQGELNIHNLSPLHGGSILEGGITFETLLTSQNMFRIGFGIYFLILPLACFFSARIRSLAERLSIPVAGRNLLISAWLAIFLSFALVLLGGGSPLLWLKLGKLFTARQ